MSLKCGADILILYKVLGEDVANYYRLEETCASEVVDFLAMRFGVDKSTLDVTCGEEDKITSTILENGKPVGLVGWDEEI